MDDSKRKAYEKWIADVRRKVAGCIIVCLVFALLDPVALYFAAACGVVWLLLDVEFFVRAYFFRPNRGLLWYQFSLLGMIILTTCVAAVCAWLEVLGTKGIWTLALGIALFAWCVRHDVQRRE